MVPVVAGADPDTPGGLATLLTQLATLDANLIEVLHERISETLNLDEVEVALQLELRVRSTGNGYWPVSPATATRTR